MNRITRTLALITVDAVAVNAALFLALWLRFDGVIKPVYINGALRLVPLATLFYIASFYSFRLYNRLWQYASINELLAIVTATLVGTMASVSLAYFRMVGGTFPLPRSIFALWTILIIALVGLSRLSWRLFREYRFPMVRNGGRAVLIVGAGDAGAMVAREFRSRSNGYGSEAHPVGFVDDDPNKQGRTLYGLPVLGTRDDIPRLVEDFGIEEIVIAMPSVRGKIIREIVEICHGTGAELRILPGIYDLLDGSVKVDPIREIRIEDILGREPVQVDLAAMAGYLAGEVVLVTGAGGSIGSELCRQVAGFGPGLLILLGHGENSIYEIHQELSRSFPDIELVQAVVDVKDEAAVDQLFRKYKPAVVFHAAAHKHVPLMEMNPAEAIKNNVLGTRVVARAADKHRSKVFVLISTDKAVNPTSIMGASKRVAEMVVQEMARRSKTRFAAVRFGNVLGSRGSVVPLFQRQIAAGGPVTVTHPEMTRYFMTIPEAVQLVIQAGALVRGGEIFVLDMGEPVKILDLARSMIILSGYEPGRDIEIVFTGVRPGEKLYEEILTAGEGVNATSHERIFIARPEEFDVARLERFLWLVSQPSWRADMAGVEELLRLVLPGFRVDKGQELVQLGEVVSFGKEVIRGHAL
ncbi:UDP-N-acetyl-alpha-D-glucosamine C6 dehydratase [Neomoorella glycerini]|uniref:UDP-N-acetyl-alpha-D-glucosamine C6 dehydratase n=1 Tax=Neomoorella glycerini TaxID=55779 RepID=A0A6I5ZRR6_9FIRM|nr:nucleoside-diphosphate sugar epimerase/dehydratase [Moorella glycerini]QGP92694.1 UDP-N-acetyl-alpha-D-glucosamine C6 dehydratase [Moorella glycerini]